MHIKFSRNIFLSIFSLLSSYLKPYFSQEYLYDYKVKAINDTEVSLSFFREKSAVLIVNIALNCAYAYTKFKELNEFHLKNKELGIDVLGFPCGQFGHELLHPEETIISQYNITFPVFRQIDVNGPNASPLYKYLKRKTSPEEVFWNFNKFLVIKNIPVERFSQQISLSVIEKKIYEYLKLEETSKDL